MVSEQKSSTLGFDSLITSRKSEPIVGLYHDQVAVGTPRGGGIHNDFRKLIKQMFRC